jgi:hypothetical protein
VDFIDHRTLLEFARLSNGVPPVRLRGVHPKLRRLWEDLDLDSDGVVFE